jgi:hypothetical protein
MQNNFSSHLALYTEFSVIEFNRLTAFFFLWVAYSEKLSERCEINVEFQMLS